MRTCPYWPFIFVLGAFLAGGCEDESSPASAPGVSLPTQTQPAPVVTPTHTPTLSAPRTAASPARDGGSSIPDCPQDRNVPLFDVPPVQMSDVLGIVPLGNLNPSGHTFPTQHLYIYVRRVGADPSSFDRPPAAVPLLAPGDIWVTSIASSERLSASPPVTDYSVSFNPCNRFMGYFHHVKALTDDFLQRVGPFDGARCNTYSTGGETYRHCRKNVSTQLRAGDRIGTAGGVGGNALDFGAYDGRMASLPYANSSRHHADPLGLDQSHVVCAIDFFRPDVRDQLRSRLDRHSGERVRTVEPICGEVDQDVRRQNKWDKRGAFKACNLDANRLRQFSDLPTSVRLDSFASPPVSSPVWRLAVRGTCPPA